MSELVDLLLFAPWRALGLAFAAALGSVAAIAAAGYGVAAWMRADDPERQR